MAVFGQKGLGGFWEGQITMGGLESRKAYRIELHLEVEGKEIQGRSFIHLDDGGVLQMKVRGYLYHDRSLSLKEIEFVGDPNKPELIAPFNRKYQLLWHRSIWDSKLEGYWQEVRHDVFNDKRERGRLRLAKVKAAKA